MSVFAITSVNYTIMSFSGASKIVATCITDQVDGLFFECSRNFSTNFTSMKGKR